MKSLERGEAFLRWPLDTLGEIQDEDRLRRQGHATFHDSVSDWRCPVILDPLRASLNADFALITLFVDGQQTAGRSVLNGLTIAVGATSFHARRAAEACVVDL